MSIEITHELNEDEDECEEEVDDVRQFEIVILNSHNNTYYPGQCVEGHVLVDTKRTFVTRGIVLQFCGRAGLEWSEKKRGVDDKCVGTVWYDAQEEYFNCRNFLFEPGLLPADVHKFSFKFKLVPPLPDNFEDNLCHIEYFLEARLKIDTNVMHDVIDRHDILIVDPIDLNKLILPDVTLPVQTQKSTTFGVACCASPPIVAFMRLDRSGYSPGETIHIQADVENNTSKTIRVVKFTLYEERGYRTSNKFHKHRDALCVVERGPVKPRQTTEWTDIPLQVPRQQIFNVHASNIFGIRHILEMEIFPAKKSKLVTNLEVTLGSIPLDNKSKSTPAQLRMRPMDLESFRTDASSKKTGSKSTVYTKNTMAEESRRRRKDRNSKIYPDDVTDTLDYDEIKKSRGYKL